MNLCAQCYEQVTTWIQSRGMEAQFDSLVFLKFLLKLPEAALGIPPKLYP